jgi:2-polyprenyl-6-hydroxyphenyl methylase/3-demethylubiquinone-9 3-methyltransferase
MKLSAQMNTEIDLLLDEVYSICITDGNKQDISYFEFHRGRYKRLLCSIKKLSIPKNTKILDIGSHYLHTSILLKKMGYDVYGMDVSPFWEFDYVIKRSNQFDIHKVVENQLESIDSLDNLQDNFGLVIFAEILEHITFNPISFWKKIHQAIQVNGVIYISTPNSLTLINIARALKKIFLLDGLGLGVSEIFSKVTYGHHWKEYSAKEVKNYFGSLSDDFKLVINKYYYKKYAWSNLNTSIFKVFSAIGNLSYFFRDELEVIIVVPTKNSWKLEKPTY